MKNKKFKNKTKQTKDKKIQKAHKKTKNNGQKLLATGDRVFLPLISRYLEIERGGTRSPDVFIGCSLTKSVVKNTKNTKQIFKKYSEKNL